MADCDAVESSAVDGLARMLRDGRITRRGFLTRAVGLLGSVAAAEGLLARVAGAQAKTDLVVAQSGDVSHLDPHMSAHVFEITVTLNLFDNLTSRHADGRLYPTGSC